MTDRTLHVTDHPTSTHLGPAAEILEYTTDDLGNRTATVLLDGDDEPVQATLESLTAVTT